MRVVCIVQVEFIWFYLSLIKTCGEIDGIGMCCVVYGFIERNVIRQFRSQ